MKFRKILREYLYKRTYNRKRRAEIKKFEDQRRVDIYSKITLSDEQREAIDRIYKTNYGEKIPYTWHRHYTAFTGKFDELYFPELLYIPEFEHYMNQCEEYVYVYSDKNVLPLIAKSVGVKTPEIFGGCSKGVFFNKDYENVSPEEFIKMVSDIGEGFIKPTIDSCSGIGCKQVEFYNGRDILQDEKIENIILNLGDDFVLQKRLKCSQSIKKLYDKSVNTFRVLTYRWNGDIVLAPTVMRIGCGGGYLDNAHAGGIFIGVTEQGKLLKEAVTEFGKRYTQHPDSGIIFENYKIEGFEEVIKSAIRMHEAIPQLGIIHWDFTINDENVPILIEANCKDGGIWLQQMAHGKSVFGKNTIDILQWMKLMKHTEREKWSTYRFGNIKNS